jgi:hypothetical protein
LTDAREIVYKCFFAAVLLFPAPELNRTRAAVTKASVILYVIANLFYSGVDVHELQNFVKATAEYVHSTLLVFLSSFSVCLSQST